MLVVNRRRGASEIVYLVDFDKQRERDVVPHQFEPRIVHKRLQIAPGTRKEVVQTQHLMAIVEETLAEMGTQKSGAAGDHHPFAHVIVASHLSPF